MDKEKHNETSGDSFSSRYRTLKYQVKIEKVENGIELIILSQRFYMAASDANKLLEIDDWDNINIFKQENRNPVNEILFEILASIFINVKKLVKSDSATVNLIAEDDRLVLKTAPPMSIFKSAYYDVNTGSRVGFLDNDYSMVPDIIAKLSDQLETCEHHFIIAPLLLNPDNTIQQKTVEILRTNNKNGWIPILQMAHNMVKNTGIIL